MATGSEPSAGRMTWAATAPARGHPPRLEVPVRAFQIKQFVLPSPIEIAVAWRTYLPELLDAASYTFREIIGGLIIGATAGSSACHHRALPLDAGLADAVRRVAASSVPILAFAPLFNDWFGLDNQLSKAMITAALCFFPVMINTVRGLTIVTAAVELLRWLAASETVILRRSSESRTPCRTCSRRCGWPSPWPARRGDRRRVLRRAEGEPRAVHRDVLELPQLRAIVGGHPGRPRWRDPHQAGRGHAVAQRPRPEGARRARQCRHEGHRLEEGGRRSDGGQVASSGRLTRTCACARTGPTGRSFRFRATC